jgi:hypothetical protein
MLLPLAWACFEFFETKNLRSDHARAGHCLATVIRVDPRTGTLAGVEFFHHRQVVTVAFHREYEKLLPPRDRSSGKGGLPLLESATACRA